MQDGGRAATESPTQRNECRRAANPLPLPISLYSGQVFVTPRRATWRLYTSGTTPRELLVHSIECRWLLAPGNGRSDRLVYSELRDLR